jgi:hypothetical protein
MKHRRTPILGDDVYGNLAWNKRYQKQVNITRPLLHAYETVFQHPFTMRQIKLTAPIPPDIAQLIETVVPNPILPSLPDVSAFLRTSKEELLNEVYDRERRLLRIPIVVDGSQRDSVNLHKGLEGTTPIISSSGVTQTLYVPEDRVRLEEEDMFSYELPDDPTIFGFPKGT